MNHARRSNRRSLNSFEMTLLILAVVAFMYFAAEILKPLALAILLCFALDPAVRLMERTRLPRGVAVVLTVLVALGLMSGVGYVVAQQVGSLAQRLPNYQDEIERKLRGVLRPEHSSTGEKLSVMVDQMTANLEKKPDPSAEEKPVQKVQVVQLPSFQERLRAFIGPYLEYVSVGGFVLILVLFMLTGREDLRDRVIGLFGRRRIGLTTRTMDEIAQRISRYLGSLVLVNSCIGVVVGVGLWLIGMPYAVLWGCLAGLLRFIPYVGPSVAFALPVIFSFAIFPRWLEPLEVIALFGVMELVLNSFLEPIIYGKTSGVSPLGLLIAAMFWTWLWGVPGLLLSTPLTICMSVLGKYVSSLAFFSTLLDDKVELEADVRLFQRLLSLDREGAMQLAQTELNVKPRIEVFDQVLIPTLNRAEREAARGNMDESEQAFIHDVIGEIIDAKPDVEKLDLATAAEATRRNGASNAPATESQTRRVLVGISLDDKADALVIRMAEQVLAEVNASITPLTESESPLEIAEKVQEKEPEIVLISHLAAHRLSSARYLVRRLRNAKSPPQILVGCWGQADLASKAVEQLTAAGASKVLGSLADLRTRVLGPTEVKANEPKAAPLPS